MNCYPSMKYQFNSQKSIYLMFYATILACGMVSLLPLLFTARDVIDSVNYGFTASGLSAMSAVMAFVAGCFAFRKNFLMAVQNGVSRKSLFLGRLGVTAVFCLLCAVLDQAVTMLFALMGQLTKLQAEAISLYELVFWSSSGTAATAISAVVFSFFLLLAVSAGGYFCTVLMYRLNKLGKTILFIVLCFGSTILQILMMILYGLGLLKEQNIAGLQNILTMF